MPLSELPMPVQIALFLAVFVLAGIYPALKKAMAGLRKTLRSAAQAREPFSSLLNNLHEELFAQPVSTGQMNDFEIIVLRRIAQAGGKALSRNQVNEPLLFGKDILLKTLGSLNRRGLVKVTISSLLGPRFVLSEAGRAYAFEQGYIVRVREGKGLMG